MTSKIAPYKIEIYCIKVTCVTYHAKTSDHFSLQHVYICI